MSRNKLFLARTAAATAACAAPLAALAHLGADAGSHHGGTAAGGAGGFLAGFVHPFTGTDHLAAMVAVGLWSALVARQGGAELLRAPLAFAAMLLAGALLGLQGLALPAVEPMIATSLLALGLLVLTRMRLPGAVSAAVVGVFALFHGIAHGTELAGSANAALVLAGMLVATVLLHGAGIAAGWALRTRSAWLPRIAGAAVAGLGVVLLTRLA
ncbi:HupE/UreJ family protein [Xylophilus sp. Leaf220]|uniref:HupE/UreJ family protein n=1 Tax=Xylophilus sp. Leaf220 TaxID=1735686 RepID=UPI0006FEDDEA|nr:HupE/UreJ family protein [Xylophilus sp. Leaf220]KQM68609.1 urease accessory protein UreJ [Xylophilus sp. Leaf220]